MKAHQRGIRLNHNRFDTLGGGCFLDFRVFIKAIICLICLCFPAICIGEEASFTMGGDAFSNDADTMDQAEQAFLQGVMHFSHEEIPKALMALDESLRLDPLGMEPRLLRGICHLKMGRMEMARKDFDLYVNGDVDKCENLNVVGKLLYMYGYYEDAEKTFREAMSINPNDPVVYSNLGSVQLEVKDWKAAEASFLKALELDPDFSDAYENLGILYFITENYSAAETVFLRAIELNEAAEIVDSLAYANLGDLYFTTGYVNACIDAYQTALEIEPELSSLRVRLGMAWQMNGDSVKARTHYELAIAYGGEPPEAHTQLAQFFIEEGKIYEAIAEYRQAIIISERSDAEPIIELGTILVRMERYEEALGLFLEAFHLGERTPAILGTLSKLCELNGHHDEALSYFELLKNNDEDDMQVRYEVAQRCIESRIEGIFDPAAAVRITDQLSKDMGWNAPGVMRIMALGYEELGDYISAAEAQQHVIAAIPESTPLTHGMRTRLEAYLLKVE